jgi:hypothetical protein
LAVLLYVAEIVAEVETRTIDVLTVNVALVAPAGMVTLTGTLAAAVLLLESRTWTPPAGAAAVKVTVPVEACRPPTTLAGFRVSEAMVGSGEATVSVAALLVTLPAALLTTTANCAPLSPIVVVGVM